MTLSTAELVVTGPLIINGSTATNVSGKHACRVFSVTWIVDMGPEGGNKGGRAMFEGTPPQLLNAQHSLTSAYLRNG